MSFALVPHIKISNTRWGDGYECHQHIDELHGMKKKQEPTDCIKRWAEWSNANAFFRPDADTLATEIKEEKL